MKWLVKSASGWYTVVEADTEAEAKQAAEKLGTNFEVVKLLKEKS